MVYQSLPDLPPSTHSAEVGWSGTGGVRTTGQPDGPMRTESAPVHPPTRPPCGDLVQLVGPYTGRGAAEPPPRRPPLRRWSQWGPASPPHMMVGGEATNSSGRGQLRLSTGWT